MKNNTKEYNKGWNDSGASCLFGFFILFLVCLGISIVFCHVNKINWYEQGYQDGLNASNDCSFCKDVKCFNGVWGSPELATYYFNNGTGFSYTELEEIGRCCK